MLNNLFVRGTAAAATAALCLTIFGVLLAAAGCGSGGGSGKNSSGSPASAASTVAAGATSEGRGRIAITVTWPDAPAAPSGKSRTIPTVAGSLYFELTRRSTGEKRSLVLLKRFQEKTITTGFEELLPTGDYVLACAARESNNGTGTTLAAGASIVTVTSGQTATATVELKGTAKVQPAGPEQTVAYLSPANSGVFQLVPTFFERDGTPAPPIYYSPNNNSGNFFTIDGVSLGLSELQYSVVSGSQFGSVTPGGVFTPIAAGTVRIHAEEPSFGVVGEWDLRVTSVKSITLAAGTGGRVNTGSQTTVTVAGGTDASDQPLNLTRLAPLLHFAVVNGGGTVDRFGNTAAPFAYFIAPATPGDSRVRVDVPGSPAAVETVFSSVGVQSVQLTPSGPILLNKPGDTALLTFVVVGSDGQPVPSARLLTNQSADSTIATVDNGSFSGSNVITITARNYGQTLIHIASSDDPTIAVDVPVNVGTGKVNVGVH